MSWNSATLTWAQFGDFTHLCVWFQAAVCRLEPQEAAGRYRVLQQICRVLAVKSQTHNHLRLLAPHARSQEKVKCNMRTNTTTVSAAIFRPPQEICYRQNIQISGNKTNQTRTIEIAQQKCIQHKILFLETKAVSKRFNPFMTSIFGT